VRVLTSLLSTVLDVTLTWSFSIFTHHSCTGRYCWGAY